MNAIAPLVLLIAAASLTADPLKRVNPESLKDRVKLKLNEEVAIQFKQVGNHLQDPKVVKTQEKQALHIRVRLATTSDAPIAPPRPGAKRPYLQVENQLQGTLQFRVLARNKGSKDFFEITDDFPPIAAGESGLMCWTFDSLIEEVVLYQFAMTK